MGNHILPGHMRVGHSSVPRTSGSFSGPKDSDMPHPERIGERLQELEEAFKTGDIPKNLVDQIAKSIIYGQNLQENVTTLNVLPPGFYDWRGRFHDLLCDNMGKLVSNPEVRTDVSKTYGISPEEVGFLHVLGHYQLLPAHEPEKGTYDA